MQSVEMYINGAGCISPQPTFNNQEFLKEIKSYSTNRIYCVDADYAKFLAPIALRRMSRIVKYGTVAGLIALQDAGIKTPDAISTGTGYGLLELSQLFLRDFISSGEGIVSPTSFIQSTHNTVSSNIALLTHCHEHNNTFTQKGMSFESTLYDALFMLSEGRENVLVGNYEEIGEFNYASLVQNKEPRAEPCNNLETFTKPQQGIIIGEGAAFFLISKEKSDNTYCRLKAFHSVYRGENIEAILSNFLSENNTNFSEIDVLLSGMNGDTKNDQEMQQLNKKFFENSSILGFKHLCGEHMTASTFGIYVASQIIKQQSIPEVLILQNKNRAPKTVLLHNKYKHYHSFFIFERC